MTMRTAARPVPLRVAAVLAGLLLALLLGPAGPATAAPGPAGTAPTAAGIADNPCYYTSICLYRDGDTMQMWGLVDVGPTPYWNSIFNLTTGQRMAVCGTGTSCGTAPIWIGYNVCHQFVAYRGGSGTTAPPAPVQSQSQPVLFCGPRLG
jgi:hypothetical protein